MDEGDWGVRGKVRVRKYVGDEEVEKYGGGYGEVRMKEGGYRMMEFEERVGEDGNVWKVEKKRG